MVKSNNFTIPLHKTFWGKEEEKAVIGAMRSGSGIGDLSFGEELAVELKNLLGTRYILPTASGTASLELACACLLKRGQEVIMPSFTFSSCANAVMLVGAKPVFADIDINSYNIDPIEIEKKISKKTKAIMIVHYAGMSCDMDRIFKIAKGNNLFVIEDTAHALGAKYRGNYLGTMSDIGCFSFHGTKNVSAGEGGFFSTNLKDISAMAEIIREKGTNRSSYIRGERKKYSWVKVGRSLVLSDILSAIALEQIKKLNTITTLRKKNATYLLKNLQTLSSKIFLPQIPKTADPNWHIFAIRVPSAIRSKVINGLRSFGIEASFHYLPLHTSAMGEKLGYRKGDLPVTEEIASTLIRLPMHPKLKKSEMDYMVEVLNKLF
ncbi:MAG: TDP-4-keto-6-deoxy-D-glucose transaminase [Candidatus Curtissbacteria bacterium GW2011_GWA1_41_11]|uniref:TDP-4-keto-6-deoxy-D-glucose transaminase n=1 Tax=Candidatus Curtissbacteria bacterium GW2011_GWA1_41_11 TaxID=1618409 RepID=A0A0G0WUP1_9BACT|nr:MAG: TDP-4-keto-6-deoxy-D-glucose transaminase [Candidatus Curtissbacteria bacterium GW2011_GWA1_41_11]